MGLSSHEPILQIVRSDPQYRELFQRAFGQSASHVTMDQVAKAIANFERTLVAGDSPFDRYYYGDDKGTMSPAAIRGLEVFLGRGAAFHAMSSNRPRPSSPTTGSTT